VTSPVEIRRSRTSWSWGFMRKHWVTFDGAVFNKRLQIVQCPWFAVLLTKIYRPDTERDPHTHHRSFASWIISGGYTEKVFRDPGNLGDMLMRTHGRWSVHVLRNDTAHTITSIEKPLWTLVFCGPMSASFDFWTPSGKKVNWKDYRKAT
jgi:hypothetical protein